MWTVSVPYKSSDPLFGDLHIDGEEQPTVAAVRARLRVALAYESTRRRPAPPAPSEASDKLASKIKSRLRLSPEQLLENAIFRAQASQAIREGKSYSRELLEWEKKDIILQAVALLRPEVEAAVAQAAAHAEAWAAQQAAQAAEQRRLVEEQETRERPTREAVIAAYERCDYRTCAQGHYASVTIGLEAKVVADTVRGDRYSSRCTYRKQESRHRIFVRPDWLETVHARGLATYDGRLVLEVSASNTFTPDMRDVQLRLRTVRQGRGTGLKTESVEVMYCPATRTARPVERREPVLAFDDSPEIARDAMIDAGLIPG